MAAILSLISFEQTQIYENWSQFTRNIGKKQYVRCVRPSSSFLKYSVDPTFRSYHSILTNACLFERPGPYLSELYHQLLENRKFLRV